MAIHEKRKAHYPRTRQDNPTGAIAGAALWEKMQVLEAGFQQLQQIEMSCGGRYRKGGFQLTEFLSPPPGGAAFRPGSRDLPVSL